ncbi:MAG: prepilin-type N-terminal cleavage/methylation domain-containing protein [Ilumatobacteraceae bacterium]|nr:prepilin-type N-terminal cleavage/methylation domain-containing protein [Ilumatobacteraceae bacterium]
MTHRTAFTLMELLVTITVVAVLVSLLIPVAGMMRRQMQVVHCASNLRQHGVALVLHAQDHRGAVPETVTKDVGNWGHYPAYIWLREGPETRDEWALNRYADYFDGLVSAPTGYGDPFAGNFASGTSQELARFASALYCPANRRGGERPWGSNWGTHGNIPTLWLTYAYFGRVDRWNFETSNPEMLTGRTLSADGILMSDSLWRWHLEPDVFTTNHSRESRSVAALGRPPRFDGVNQLMGDGSVHWKPSSAFPLAAMRLLDAPVPRTFTNNHGPGPLYEDNFFF